MKKVFTQSGASTLILSILAVVFFATDLKSQVLVPASGSNTVACGTNTTLMDHAGTGSYVNYVDGFTVLDAGFNAQINISGTYDTESNYDYIYIYSGAGTGGALLATYHGNGTINYTGTAGQTLTVRFYTDGSVTYTGFNLTITYTGPCFATPCTGSPSANSVVTPTFAICPNSTAGLSLANNYSVGGLTFQWQAATQGSIGPYSNVTPGNSQNLTTPSLTANTWYQAIITCTNSNLSVVSAPGLVVVQDVTTNTVPYHEGFEGISAANKLPNCSWTANNLGSQALTYVTSDNQGRVPRTGSKFASFYYSPGGSRNFYSNGIWLNTGVTYSAAVWYTTEYYGYNNWTDLSILAGPQQNSASQFVIATTGGAALSATYKALTNTFSVPTSGLYYINIKANVTTSQYAYYLSWDDLSITVPCQLNQPAMTITPDQTVCAGANANIIAAGVDTYTWHTGENSSSVIYNPLTTTIYSVTGTSTLTGCPANLQHIVTVNPKPEVGIFTPNTSICAGGSVVLTAFGANTYAWSNNANTQITTVSPLTTTSYSVFGTNTFGCQNMAMQTIVVHTAPNVQGFASPAEVCPGQAVLLTATGALSYEWVSSSAYIKYSPATVFPQQTTSYSVTGKDANGCTTTQMVPVSVLDCTGLAAVTSLGNVRVFPNPNSGVFTVLVNGKAQVEISDLTGRHVASINGADHFEINISHLANGIYYVKVQAEHSLDMIRIVKE